MEFLMDNIGLNTEIFVGGKKFHIQTNVIEPGDKIIANVFDKGRVVIKQELHLNGDNQSNNMQEKVELLHKQVSSEIELLFFISEKVRTIRHAPSNNKLGIVFGNKNLYEEAIHEFKTAIEIEPDFADAYKNLGTVYLKNKQFDEAIETLKQGLERKPDYPDLHNTLGLVYLEQNKYIDAISEFKAALEKNTYFAKSHLNLSIALLRSIVEEYNDEQLQDFGKRKDLVISHLQIAENFIETDKLLEAYQSYDEGEFEKTLNILEQINSENYESLGMDLENEFYLKFMFGGKGKDDQFILDHINKLKELIYKYPKYADLRNNLGIAYLIQCRNLFLNALDEFRQALKINPGFKKAEKNLKLAENDGKGFLILLRAILK